MPIDLSYICNKDEPLNGIIVKNYTYDSKNYSILSQDKDNVTREWVMSGKCIRSVIMYEGKVSCVSPFKSVKLDEFDWSVPSELQITKFIDGTMINIFYNGAEWVLSTRSTVGGNVSFFRSDTFVTFRKMFDDALSNDYDIHSEFYDDLDKTCSYSFVLQHPTNRIVTPIEKPVIHLIGIYKIDGHNVEYVDPFKSNVVCKINRPQLIMFDNPSIETLTESLSNTNWSMMGIHVMNKSTGIRTKCRNPKYEEMRRLRGNQPKLQYRFLELLHDKEDIDSFIEIWPEYTEQFNMYRSKLTRMCKTIYDIYSKRFITHEIESHSIPIILRKIIYSLHNLYISSKYTPGNKIKINYNVTYHHIISSPTQQIMFIMSRL
jgi:hypothetical protein